MKKLRYGDNTMYVGFGTEIKILMDKFRNDGIHQPMYNDSLIRDDRVYGLIVGSDGVYNPVTGYVIADAIARDDLIFESVSIEEV